MEKQKKIIIKNCEDYKKLKDLKAGDKILLSAVLYTARDMAHKKLVELIEAGEKLPFDIENAIIYYTGPTPAKENQKIGSAGPTTSYRMDLYAPVLMDKGVVAMIGKGNRNQEVVDSMVKNEAVYFAATGGVAGLIGKTVTSSEIVAFEELGAEAIRRLEVVDMPLIVAIDKDGRNLYQVGPKEYLGKFDY